MSEAQRESARCPLCLCAVGLSDAPEPEMICAECQSRCHVACYEELGGCAVDGCPNAVEVKKADLPQTHWGATTKTCPMCAETITVEALKCAFCNFEFADTRPVDREDLIPKAPDPVLIEIRKKAKWLLVFSIIGCTSPLALLFGGMWYRGNSAEIYRAGSSTRAMVLISLLICVVYLVMMGAGALVFSLKNQAS
jgi:hypothetical protein